MLRIVVFGLAITAMCASATESVCYGTPSKGRVEGAIQITLKGKNFYPYSSLGVGLGRTFVHSKVARVINDAYANLARINPRKKYMYGESGWEKGGQIKPHRTHQNGLAVDFMVPVLDMRDKSVLLPTNMLNKFGYDIEFDQNAQYKNLRIDFEAIADHLYALHLAANKSGVGISRVIFEPTFIPKLYASKRGDWIKKHIQFMQGHAWVRHDEHYHVDFSLPCRSLNR